MPTLLVSCCLCLHVAKSLTSFKLCATIPNNTQQHGTGPGVKTDATCLQHPTMLGVAGQQCCVCLLGALGLASV